LSADAQERATLEVDRVSKIFPIRLGAFKKGALHAVVDVSCALEAGSTLGVVGESGSGKTTLARLILRLLDPTEGSIKLDGTELVGLSGKELRAMRSRMQMVFQDPFDSLSPWQTVGDTLIEPLELHGQISKAQARETVAVLLERVGLTGAYARRYPHELSGGQQQRVGIARAIITNPKLVVLDEPTSSLDISVQAQILLLLSSLQEERQLSYLFISHNLNVIRYLAHRVIVMYLGRIVEEGPVRTIFSDSRHPYTEALLAASPRADPHRRPVRASLKGEQPSPIGRPTGCPLFGRCPIALPECGTMPQKLVEVSEGHRVACWRRAPP
jgi:oligopeptide/dipeptide ABC transporter ATP-binding protein